MNRICLQISIDSEGTPIEEQMKIITQWTEFVKKENQEHKTNIYTLDFHVN